MVSLDPLRGPASNVSVDALFTIIPTIEVLLVDEPLKGRGQVIVAPDAVKTFAKT